MYLSVSFIKTDLEDGEELISKADFRERRKECKKGRIYYVFLYIQVKKI